METIIPVNIENLLRNQGVESVRVEFKASWDAETTGAQILRTICAFANDFQNLNGGYIVVGIAERDGRAILPPVGLSDRELDAAQKWLAGNCNRIEPEYHPVFSPETYEGRNLLVLWCPASDIRPHQAPENHEAKAKKFYIRIGAQTVDASKHGHLQQLIELTARIPFDDRRSHSATTDALRLAKVREFLHDIKSGLLSQEDAKTLYRQLKIAVSINGHDAPKNIGLLMFSDDSGAWFRNSHIEIVQFPNGTAGDIIIEKVFRGGIHEQLKNALHELEGLSSLRIEKQKKSFQAKHTEKYPMSAVREALVNAVYHKGYDYPPEPIKVYLYPDRMEITSYPGPMPGINHEHFLPNAIMPLVPARNRRIGEFLKELELAESRGTGLSKIHRSMHDNGSPPPTFDFDENRSYFRVTLPAKTAE
ncbi:MAG: putative DNA binding domain-containing protein [Puniceicoccales bacterium]|nr:putative DNA binding domain-containing protein [Puniceicoccales bacterium]